MRKCEAGDKPRYFEVARNADGSERYYWRPKDRPGVPLGNDRAAAIAEAHRLNAQRDAERAGLAGPGRIDRTGTVRWLADSFKRDPDFEGKAPKTRREYDRHLTWLLDLYGDLPAAAITPKVIQELKRGGRATPWETNARLRTVRLLYAWGRRHGLVESNPAAAFRQLKTAPRDVVWTGEEIAAFLGQALPSIRVAVALGLYSLQREGDLIRLTWAAYDGTRLELRQRKTGKLLAAEAHPLLRQVLDATPRRAVQILVSEATGRPYHETGFRHAFAHERTRLGLRKELQFRDLRRTGAVTLSRLGVPVQQIAALGGWDISHTTKILETYTPLDEQMATAAVRTWAERG